MSFYLVDDIEQGTPKWHQWRKGVIGASEAVIIMGDNRWKGRQQLIDEKLGRIEPFSGNEATREGQIFEEYARVELVKKYKEKLFPTVVQDSTEPFLAASLDAINKKSNQIYEIKCGLKTYEKVSASKNVPSYYVAQVQHMLMITQMESLIFAVYRPNETLITLEVFRNDVYIRNLRRKEKDFMHELESYGHKIQKVFRGKPIGKVTKTRKIASTKKLLKKSDSTWVVEDGLLRFWDGLAFLEGKEPGLYEVDGADHYWEGEQWSIPDKAGLYLLNGEEHYWNGDAWD